MIGYEFIGDASRFSANQFDSNCPMTTNRCDGFHRTVSLFQFLLLLLFCFFLWCFRLVLIPSLGFFFHGIASSEFSVPCSCIKVVIMTPDETIRMERKWRHLARQGAPPIGNAVSTIQMNPESIKSIGNDHPRIFHTMLLYKIGTNSIQSSRKRSSNTAAAAAAPATTGGGNSINPCS